MKKFISMLMACTMMFGLAACGTTANSDGADSTQPANGESQQTTEPAANGSSTPAGSDAKALVVYFSATGTTKGVAEELAEMQGADLYEIVPEQPYTDEDLNYDDDTTRATVEQNDDTARPAISGGIDNLDEYDVIYVGYPIWWHDMPRILYTFFDTYDMSGKTLAPFCTSIGAGIAESVESMAALEPSATITGSLRIASDDAADATDALTQWVSEIGLEQ